MVLAEHFIGYLQRYCKWKALLLLPRGITLRISTAGKSAVSCMYFCMWCSAFSCECLKQSLAAVFFWFPAMAVNDLSHQASTFV